MGEEENIEEQSEEQSANIEEKDQNLAEKKINEMCKKLLVNLIIEDYKIQKI